MKKQIVLSGIRPSGVLHIGNYLGAIKQWVEMQRKYQLFAMIADLHAITTPLDPKELYEKTLETARLYLACGIDPKKSVIFIQSQVPAHLELAWILNTITPIGELERMTQFKDKKETAGTMAGLLNYPVLQAADVLIYKTSAVPIGEDQLQHLEFARTLARKFNNRFGEIFPIPQALIQKGTARIMALDDPAKKMSKSTDSSNNYISLLDSPEEIRHKFKTAVTDSGSDIKYNPDGKPAISNLINIFSSFSGISHSELEKKYEGRGYAEFKRDLAELTVNFLEPIQKKYHKIRPQELKSILRSGAKKARTVANQTLVEVKRKVGFVL